MLGGKEGGRLERGYGGRRDIKLGREVNQGEKKGEREENAFVT